MKDIVKAVTVEPLVRLHHLTLGTSDLGLEARLVMVSLLPLAVSPYPNSSDPPGSGGRAMRSFQIEHRDPDIAVELSGEVLHRHLRIGERYLGSHPSRRFQPAGLH